MYVVHKPITTVSKSQGQPDVSLVVPNIALLSSYEKQQAMAFLTHTCSSIHYDCILVQSTTASMPAHIAAAAFCDVVTAGVHA